jgi:putative ABC transport system substrate-binding protein
MQRREFISLIGGTAAVWPLGARGQPGGRVRRIGLLFSGSESDAEQQERIVVFRKALAALGWEEGRNLAIEFRFAAGDIERMRVYAAELVRLAPDIIVCSGTPVLGALHDATRSIPIVFAGVNDPVGLGYVASMARPGGNITGFSLMEVSLIGKWLELLKQMAPAVKRAALVFNPDTTAYYFNFLRSFEGVPKSVAVELKGTPVRDQAEIERVCAEFAREPGGSLIIPADPFSMVRFKAITRLAEQLKLPTIGFFRRYAVDGGLMSYGPDSVDVFRFASAYVDRILKGEKPADLPVQGPTKFTFVVNLKTAKALGLDVPPMLLALTDEVIE